MIPIKTYTDITPEPWQQQSVDFLVNNFGRQGCLLNVAPGLGKSLSVLWAIDHLKSLGKLKKVLITAPLSTIGPNVWEKEMKHFPHLTYALALGSKKQKSEAMAKNADVTFMNHEGFLSLITLNKGGTISKTKTDLPTDFDMIVCDEATLFKNHKTQKFTRLKKYLRMTGIHYVAMTGTAVSDNPLNAYTMMLLINDNFSLSYTAWKELTMYPDQYNQWKWHVKQDADKMIAKYMTPALVITDDVLDLPKIQVIPYHIPLSKQQKQVINDIKIRTMSVQDGHSISANNPAVVVGKMMQALCGTVYSDEGESISLDFTERYESLRDIIVNNSAPTVVFINYKESQRVLHDKLSKEGLRGAIVNGDVVDERQQVFTDFQNGKLDYILCHEKTCAFGVDLTASNTIVYFCVTFSNEMYRQALKRIQRRSSLERGHKMFRVFHFYSTKWEEQKYAELESKEEFQNSVRQIMMELQNVDLGG